MSNSPKRRRLHIAVTALNATDNPGPGITVIRALRDDPDLDARLIGLAYDALEPGAYARDIVDDVFLLPWPSQGLDALRERLRYIDERVGLDVIIPTLDSELDAFIALEDDLKAMGIAMFLPTRQQLAVRSKAHLAKLGETSDIRVPPTRVVQTVEDLYRIHQELHYPLWIKGTFYGATLARDVGEAVQAYWNMVTRWGVPVIVQESVKGSEFNVVAVGDGLGGLVGAVAMKKTYLTDKGKGWAGVTVKDPELIEMTRRFMAATKWRGPCEVEVIQDESGRYHLLEINPRFPAWTYLSAGAGMNLPSAVARLALGQTVAPMTDYRVGTMFVRISIDQIATIADLERLSTLGEYIKEEER